MSLTKEELMITRYQVVADYPDNAVKVGGVIEYKDSHGCFIADSFNGKRGKVWFRGQNDVKFKDFPAIFRKLEWWQNRKSDELPEYVMRENVVFKLDDVAGYLINYPEEFLPATIEEYECQNKATV